MTGASSAEESADIVVPLREETKQIIPTQHIPKEFAPPSICKS